MTATVVDLNTHRRYKRDLDGVKDSVGQVIMDNYRHHQLADIASGIHAACRVIDAGGSFMDAMDAADKTIQIAALGVMPAQRTARLLRLAEGELRTRLAGQPEHDIVSAVARARRVLEGGGTWCAAVYLALGGELEGPGAA